MLEELLLVSKATEREDAEIETSAGVSTRAGFLFFSITAATLAQRLNLILKFRYFAEFVGLGDKLVQRCSI